MEYDYEFIIRERIVITACNIKDAKQQLKEAIIDCAERLARETSINNMNPARGKSENNIKERPR